MSLSRATSTVGLASHRPAIAKPLIRGERVTQAPGSSSHALGAASTRFLQSILCVCVCVCVCARACVCVCVCVTLSPASPVPGVEVAVTTPAASPGSPNISVPSPRLLSLWQVRDSRPRRSPLTDESELEEGLLSYRSRLSSHRRCEGALIWGPSMTGTNTGGFLASQGSQKPQKGKVYEQPGVTWSRICFEKAGPSC